MGINFKDTNCVELRELASRICKDYLRGSWKKITATNIQIKRISGGLSNWLYHVCLPSANPPRGTEPSEILLRIYGQGHGEKVFEGLVTESVIFTLLSERRLGPRLHGVFPDGRIEEYIPARPLQTRELANPQMSARIASKMALIHDMQVPINKEPRWLWSSLERWLPTALANLKDPGNIDEIDRLHVAKLRKTDIHAEVEFLRGFLKKINSPVVFCHNDLQEGNILLKGENKHQETSIDKVHLMIIDFEYCAYNHRGFDFANHFAEWRYDYSNPERPYYYRDVSSPTREQMLHFIRAYLKAMDDHNTKPETILEETEAFSLASHLFWAVWSIINAKVSEIPFGYWDYGSERLSMYHKIKNYLIEKSEFDLNRNLN